MFLHSQSFASNDSQLLLKEWDKLVLSGGILYRQSNVLGELRHQLVLPKVLQDQAISGLHDDHGHLGFDRVLDLVRARFYWPRMYSYIRHRLQNCLPCIRRKSPINQRVATMVSIDTCQPMELVCLDYLSLEESKGGYDNILVITDHFTRYAVAIPTRNQTASTTARVLYDNFLVHYGFPARLHSDQGRNFESAIIQQLCKQIGTKKCRTTPYHPQGNGATERFNSTLLSMLGTLTDEKKADWKSYVSSLVHAYNSTRNDSTRYAPFYLMFGRHPRLPIDVALGIHPVDEAKSPGLPLFVENLRKRLRTAYDIASAHAEKASKRYKKVYDAKIRESILQVGDRVLVRKLGIKGKKKLENRWEESPCVVKAHPHIPVYVIQREDGSGKERVLHRNLLRSLSTIPIQNRRKLKKVVQIDEPVEDSTESDSESECGVILNQNVPEFVPLKPPDVSDLTELDDHVHVVVDELDGQDASVGRDLVVDIVHEDDPIQDVAPILETVDSTQNHTEVDSVSTNDSIQGIVPGSETTDTISEITVADDVRVFPVPAPRRSLRVSKPPDRYTDLGSVHAKVQLLVDIHDRFREDKEFSRAIIDIIKDA